jgi:glycosyltransferase involved in cell wall biosynthesis
MTVKLLHAITGLQIGGAENMLLRLLEAGEREKFAAAVLALMDPDKARFGSVAPKISALGVPIATLDMARGSPMPAHVWRLCRTMRAINPDVVQGWMYHGNLAATVGSWSLPEPPPVVWNVRHSVHDLALEKPLTRLIIRLSARLSRLPRAIIYNSRVSAAQHQKLGFEAGRSVVIANGFDTARFKSRLGAKERLCQELGIDPGCTVIGMIARNHPMKDPGNLLRAGASLRAGGRAVHLVMVGTDMIAAHRELSAAVREVGLEAQVSLLGERDDIPAVVAGFDIATLPSAWGEGFPNVLGEAMASGVPCVATDVGDSTWVVGPHGLIVPPRQSEALANALGRLIDLGPEARRQLGLGGRARIVQHFSIHEVVRQYEALHLQVSASRAARRRWSGDRILRVRHRRAV